MDDRKKKIALDVDARETVTKFRVTDAQTAHEFNLGRFEVAEHGSVVNAPARVGIYEANARVKTERLVKRHFIRMSLRFESKCRRDIVSIRCQRWISQRCYGL
jgi:hypothetical protein